MVLSHPKLSRLFLSFINRLPPFTRECSSVDIVKCSAAVYKSTLVRGRKWTNSSWVWQLQLWNFSWNYANLLNQKKGRVFHNFLTVQSELRRHIFRPFSVLWRDTSKCKNIISPLLEVCLHWKRNNLSLHWMTCHYQNGLLPATIPHQLNVLNEGL